MTSVQLPFNFGTTEGEIPVERIRWLAFLNSRHQTRE
jgi:hypothetical protein